jgi:2,3-bisphosphoglycerate-independent phosphoglycerate mutase
MKYIVIVPDGMADLPVAEFNNQTPLQAARTPNMDYLTTIGQSGLVQTIPEGLPAGSDVGNLALMGYDPVVNYTGRAPLEAASLGVQLREDEVAFRCNLVTVDDNTMKDYSAGHISSEEAAILIEYLQRTLSYPDIRFYPGKSYRHLMVIKALDKTKTLAVQTKPPHDILNQSIEPYLPKGPGSDLLLSLMHQSRQILAGHQINQLRQSNGENIANMIWLWGQGGRPVLETFKQRYALSGSVISAVDLVNGIGFLAGLKVIQVPGANGYYDTNYAGKASYALESLKQQDFVYIHIEAPDEAGHNGDALMKKECIERIDQMVMAPVVEFLKRNPQVRVLVAPDHPTPVSIRTHTRDAVPFVMAGAGIKSNGLSLFDEVSAASTGMLYQSGESLIKAFMKK